MKKKIISERRILIGLIGLLFLMGFVHTMGILSLSKNMATGVPKGSQAAQVATLSICLQITPAYNLVKLGENFVEATLPGATVAMYFNIKNVCTSTINIVDVASLNTINNPALFTPQVRLSNGSITNILSSNLGALSTYGIASYSEFSGCPTCGNNVQSYSSSVPNSLPSVVTYPIAPQATRTIVLQANYGKTEPSTWPIRMMPKAIKWIPSTSLTDNHVSATDIITTPIPATQGAYWASDFVDVDYTN